MIDKLHVSVVVSVSRGVRKGTIFACPYCSPSTWINSSINEGLLLEGSLLLRLDSFSFLPFHPCHGPRDPSSLKKPLQSRLFQAVFEGTSLRGPEDP